MSIEDYLPDALKKLTPQKIEGVEGLWYNIAPLGKLLKEQNIEYDGKLKDVLLKVPGLEMHIDRSRLIPVTYIQCKNAEHVIMNVEKRIKPRYAARQALFDWAYLGKFEQTLSLLKEKALPESWKFDYEPDGKYSILDSYLRYTFFRIQKENKICYTKDGLWAIFNTGLVNKTYLPIFALFSKNKNSGKQPWFFNSFIAEGEKSKVGRISVIDFPNRPKRAQYFDDPTELLYIVSESSNELSPNFEHIITDNIERLPISLLKELVSEGISEETKKEELQNLVAQGNIARKLQERFRTAIDVTRNRVLWNYKTAIPTYYPISDRITLLLPLCLVNEDTVDLALVVSKGEGGYLAETIYPLDWAYKCARLICRPDSDWLTPSAIPNSNTEEDNE